MTGVQTCALPIYTHATATAAADATADAAADATATAADATDRNSSRRLCWNASIVRPVPSRCKIPND